MNLEGLATNRILLTSTTALEVTWAVDLHGSNLITGMVSNGVWTAELLGDLGSTYSTTNPAPNLGRYTWVIPGEPGSTNEPAGDSTGTAVVDKANVMKFGGTLAEGTKVVQKVAVSRNGHWPLYVSLHSGQGTRYIAPTGTTNRVLRLTNGQFIVSGGSLAQDYTNDVFLLPNNKLTNASPPKLTWSLKTATGLFTGTYQPTNATSAVTFAGAVFKKSTNASGWFIETNQSGRVLLQAAP